MTGGAFHNLTGNIHGLLPHFDVTIVSSRDYKPLGSLAKCYITYGVQVPCCWGIRPTLRSLLSGHWMLCLHFLYNLCSFNQLRPAVQKLWNSLVFMLYLKIHLWRERKTNLLIFWTADITDTTKGLRASHLQTWSVIVQYRIQICAALFSNYTQWATHIYTP